MRENIISTFNNMMLLPATMVVVVNTSDTSALALLAMVIILSLVFIVIVMRGVSKWPFRQLVARASALGVVLLITSCLAAAKAIVEYEKGSMLPLWFHIIAVVYILLYWGTLYAVRAIGACHIAYLERHICRNPRK